MDELRKKINRQIESNKGKNLFWKDPENTLKFTQETIHTLENLGDISEADVLTLIEYTTDQVVQEFCRVNQYFSIGEDAKKALRAIYADLLAKMSKKEGVAESIAKEHYQNVKQWLQATNPFAEKVYSAKGDVLQPVVCAEYNVELQLEILRIDPEQLIAPVLDIGCGQQGELVRFLRNKGITTYGFDRLISPDHDLIEGDWLEYPYGTEKWGTVISHLGFSNHFNHHHLREDGNFIGYARVYMTILNALKIGGSFHYAPDLPFIEQYLDANKFQLQKQPLNSGDFQATIIKRVS